MLKKMCLLALVMCGAAVFAGERAGIYMMLMGDAQANLDVKSGSSDVTIVKDHVRNDKKEQVQRSAMVAIDEKDPVEVEIEVTPSAAGTFRIVCQGWGEGREHAYVECSKFEVNGEQVIPSDKFKSIEIYGYRRMLKDFSVEAGKPVTIKATFAKVPEERLEQLTAAAERRAAAKKAREAKKAALVKPESEKGEDPQK